MNHCKTIADLCESFDYLSYISQEESLVCNICVTYPSQGGSHTSGRFTYNIKKDDIYKSTKVLLWDFRNLKTHVKRHFENEIHLNNDCDWQNKEIYKGKCETREHAIGMQVARLCYGGYLIGLCKRNVEQEILTDSMLVTSIIARNFIQISCHSFLNKLLKSLRVSLALV